MQRAKEDDEEEYDDNSEEEADNALFFMEPDHDKIRAQEDLKTQDYLEAGITTDTINVLKQGNMDHSQKTCYHCNHKGHIKANCPAWKRLKTKPWTKRPGPHEKRTTAGKGYEVRGGQGKPFSSWSGTSKKAIHWECTSHPAVRGGFSVKAGLTDGSMLATMNAIELDIEDNSPRESLTATCLQQDSFNFPWAIYMQAKTGHETPGNVKRLQNDQLTKKIINLGR